MSSLLLSKPEQGIVIFHIWKSLSYPLRILMSIFLILVGFVIQFYSTNLFPGILFVIFGNLLLLVKGYDTRIKLGTYKPDAEWVKTDKQKFEDILSINAKVKKWDISATDITSGRGIFFFILLIISLIIIRVSYIFYSDQFSFLLTTNIALLLLPHWFTGVRRITTTPLLVQKIKLFREVVTSYSETLLKDKLDYLIYVKGKEQKKPTDAKIKIEFKDQPENFMGLYGQISLNYVKDRHYPYFYVVLVAKEGFGLDKYFKSIKTSKGVIKEQSVQDGVEIIVIRQYTTKTSGYFTGPNVVQTIMADGIQASRSVIGNKSDSSAWNS